MSIAATAFQRVAAAREGLRSLHSLDSEEAAEFSKLNISTDAKPPAMSSSQTRGNSTVKPIELPAANSRPPGNVEEYLRELTAKVERVEAQNLSLIDEIEAIREFNVQLQEEKAAMALQMESLLK